MRMKPGCGCLLIVLSLSNIVLLASTIVAVTKGSLTWLGAIGISLLFAANALAAGMLGFWAFTGRMGPVNANAEGDTLMEGSDDEVQVGEVTGEDTEVE